MTRQMSEEALLRKDLRTAPVKLQRRHFVLLAGIIRSMPVAYQERVSVASHFATKLVQTNSNFDRDRFFKACMES